MALSNLEKSLIDEHFRFAELPRHYSPSGIYGQVQRFIDDGLAAAVARHDPCCEMHDGFARWCSCARRRAEAAVNPRTGAPR